MCHDLSDSAQRLTMNAVYYKSIKCVSSLQHTPPVETLCLSWWYTHIQGKTYKCIKVLVKVLGVAHKSAGHTNRMCGYQVQKCVLLYPCKNVLLYYTEQTYQIMEYLILIVRANFLQYI